MRDSLVSLYKRKKRSFLLVEVLVSFTLFFLIFCALGFWQRHLLISSRRNERLYKSFLQENIAYKKLRELFRFTSQFESLSSDTLCSVIFDRGVYSDPELAGEVAGFLCYNTHRKQLDLCIRSLKNQHKMETFVLLDHVSRVCCIPFSRDAENNDLPNRVTLHIYRNSPNLCQERLLVYQFNLGK
ncbi:hypothetical protein BOKEGFJH_00700 [Chlamydia avium]|uniref:Uncharacterized protein n=1 Tax=Chlamydia avium TaxID=1457141 RepID=A0ABP2X7Q1_9CHLA|nr:DUF1494 domain-containing protein [Chlamydia avium]EPP38850.1 hypothetical protein CP10881SC42_0153 [Chlamydia avium]VVT43165.1 hypothetical protein BOKEGFJH_00700 [Chlamydia avium]